MTRRNKSYMLFNLQALVRIMGYKADKRLSGPGVCFKSQCTRSGHPLCVCVCMCVYFDGRNHRRSESVW